MLHFHCVHRVHSHRPLCGSVGAASPLEPSHPIETERGCHHGRTLMASPHRAKVPSQNAQAERYVDQATMWWLKGSCGSREEERGVRGDGGNDAALRRTDPALSAAERHLELLLVGEARTSEEIRRGEVAHVLALRLRGGRWLCPVERRRRHARALRAEAQHSSNSAAGRKARVMDAQELSCIEK